MSEESNVKWNAMLPLPMMRARRSTRRRGLRHLVHERKRHYYLPSALDKPVAEQLKRRCVSAEPFDADHCV